MTKRLNTTLSDDAFDLLQSLATQCDLTVGQCIGQLAKRYGDDLTRLFAPSCAQLRTAARELRAADPVVPSKPTECEPTKQAAPEGGGAGLALFDSMSFE
jgi:hypothetical protein